MVARTNKLVKNKKRNTKSSKSRKYKKMLSRRQVGGVRLNLTKEEKMKIWDFITYNLTNFSRVYHTELKRSSGNNSNNVEKLDLIMKIENYAKINKELNINSVLVSLPLLRDISIKLVKILELTPKDLDFYKFITYFAKINEEDYDVTHIYDETDDTKKYKNEELLAMTKKFADFINEIMPRIEQYKPLDFYLVPSKPIVNFDDQMMVYNNNYSSRMQKDRRTRRSALVA